MSITRSSRTAPNDMTRSGLTCSDMAPHPRRRTAAAKRGTIEPVIWFWVVALVLIIGASAVIVAGRGDAMTDVYEDRPDLSVDRSSLSADEVASVRFTTAVRGYRMDEVDAFVERLAAELRARSAPASLNEEPTGHDHRPRTEPDGSAPEPADSPADEHVSSKPTADPSR